MNGDADNVVNVNVNRMEIDAEVVHPSSSDPDSSMTKMNKDDNQIAGIISLDSPSPPTRLASPAHPPVADLNINND